MLPADLGSLPSVLDDPDRSAPFGALGVPPRLVRALARDGITEPFAIQTATIPDALAGQDILGRARTGSGKTLAFGLPMLTRLAAGAASHPHRPKGLVLVPTRELAGQIADALAPLATALRRRVGTATGGGSYEHQIGALSRGVDVLVATPGRLGDLIDRAACDLGGVEITVLDEADRMADMGFLPDVTALLARTPAGGQRMLFSATLDGDVDALVGRFLSDPVRHAVGPAVASVETMAHHLLVVPPAFKFGVAASIAARSGRTLMFVRTQLAVDRLAAQLAEVGVRAGALHGGKTQRVRSRTLAEFREGTVDVLVATDVAARGLHVEDISLVVHVDPPGDAKDYLHRAGRTARAGASGTVVTLVLPKQRRSTVALVAKAGVAPELLPVRPGDAALARITGARPPSGVPVIAAPDPVRPVPHRRRRDDAQSRGRADSAGGWAGSAGRMRPRSVASGHENSVKTPAARRGRPAARTGRRRSRPHPA
jgi:superfamily II DNA/RNA helicase